MKNKDLVDKDKYFGSIKNIHKHYGDSISRQNRKKIDKILARVNLQTLRDKVQDQTPYQAYIDCIENYNKKNQHMKMTKQERLQIYKNDW